MSELKHDPLAIQMSVTRTFTEGSGATWITSVKQDEPIDVIHDVSDKMMAAIARQELWARIGALNNEIEMHAKQRAQVDFSIKSMQEKHGDFTRVSVDTRNAYNQSKEGMLRLNTLISALQAEQDRLRKDLK